MNFWKYVCLYCQKEAEEFKVFPSDCDCEGYQKAKEEWIEEYRQSDEYEPPLTPEEIEQTCPVTFLGERLIVDKDGSHKLKLEARQFVDGEGLSIWFPIPHKDTEDGEERSEGSGLCFDFGAGDAEAMYDLLGEYLENK